MRAPGAFPFSAAGVIYPVPDAEYVVPDFAIPKHWRRAYGARRRVATDGGAVGGLG